MKQIPNNPACCPGKENILPYRAEVKGNVIFFAGLLVTLDQFETSVRPESLASEQASERAN